jgi:hypothetical protein
MVESPPNLQFAKRFEPRGRGRERERDVKIILQVKQQVPASKKQSLSRGPAKENG